MPGMRVTVGRYGHRLGEERNDRCGERGREKKWLAWAYLRSLSAPTNTYVLVSHTNIILMTNKSNGAEGGQAEWLEW